MGNDKGLDERKGEGRREVMNEVCLVEGEVVVGKCG